MSFGETNGNICTVLFGNIFFFLKKKTLAVSKASLNLPQPIFKAQR